MQLGRATTDLPYVAEAADGRLLFRAMPTARFLVTRDSVVVDTSLRPDAPEWRVVLLGPVLGLLCYLRGLVPLHASAVRIGTKAVALAGPSGIGKSTLAAALAQRGHDLICEDVCPLDVVAEQPLVLPTFPALKLNAASLGILGVDPSGLPRVQFEDEKYQLLLRHNFDPSPQPLSKVYLLEDALEGDDAIISVDGVEAFERVSAEIFRPAFGRRLLTKPTLFAMAAKLTGRVEVRRLVRQRNFMRLPTLIKSIEVDALKG